MTIEQFANNARSLLVDAIDDVETTIRIQDGSTFSPLPNFTVKIDDEYLAVNSIYPSPSDTTTFFIVQRGSESTIPARHAKLALVRQVVTAGTLEQLKEDAVNEAVAVVFGQGSGSFDGLDCTIINSGSNPVPVVVQNQVTSSGEVTVTNFPVTQSVFVVNQASSSITGHVTVDNPVTQLTASIANFPSQQHVIVDNSGSLTTNVSNFPALQLVSPSGTFHVTVDNQVSSVSVSNLPETQSVSVVNFPAATTQVTASVSNFPTSFQVSNFPATQSVAITGTPTVNANVTFPVTQSVLVANPFNGHVTVDNPTTSVSVSNLPATQSVLVANPVTSVSVSNFPTQFAVTSTGSLPVTVSNTLNAQLSGTVNTNIVSGTMVLVQSGTAVITGTVHVDNPVTSVTVSSLPNVTIGSMPNVTVANPVTSVSVSSLPSITIANTGFTAVGTIASGSAAANVFPVVQGGVDAGGVVRTKRVNTIGETLVSVSSSLPVSTTNGALETTQLFGIPAFPMQNNNAIYSVNSGSNVFNFNTWTNAVTAISASKVFTLSGDPTNNMSFMFATGTINLTGSFTGGTSGSQATVPLYAGQRFDGRIPIGANSLVVSSSAAGTVSLSITS